MAEAAPGIRVPRPALWGALGLIVFTFSAILVARDTGLGTVETPSIAEADARELVFRDTQDGMEVLDADRRRIAHLVFEGDSFAMTAVRTLAAHRAGADDPVAAGYRVRIVRGPGGGLQLVDPQTGRHLPLAGFGADNARAFTVWLEAPAG